MNITKITRIFTWFSHIPLWYSLVILSSSRCVIPVIPMTEGPRPLPPWSGRSSGRIFSRPDWESSCIPEIQEVIQEDSDQTWGPIKTHEKSEMVWDVFFTKNTWLKDLMVFNICLKPQKIGRLKQQTWAVLSHKRPQLEPTQMGTLTRVNVWCVFQCLILKFDMYRKTKHGCSHHIDSKWGPFHLNSARWSESSHIDPNLSSLQCVILHSTKQTDLNNYLFNAHNSEPH